MKIQIRILLLVTCCLTTTFADSDKPEEDELDDDIEELEIKEEDDVMVLTESNFDEVINSRETVLVEFYAPWCGHCKSLAPEYAAAAKLLKADGKPGLLAKVDATEEKSLGERYSVSGYPTIKLFKNGQPYDYDGPRERIGILSYVTERSDPSWKPPPDAVVTLNSENFDDVVSGELVLVEFYAPWCGHCKELAPVYEKAAQALKKQDPPIILAKIDATQENGLASKYEVTGYPKMKIFRKGKVTDYVGPRDEAGIVNYMISQAGEAAKPLKDQAAIKNSMKLTDIIVVGFFEGVDNPLLRVYMDAANELRDHYSFGIMMDKAARNAYKVNSGSIVVFSPERFFTKFEPKWHVLNKADFSVSDVVEFVKKHDLPLVGEFTNVLSRRFHQHLPICLIFYTVDWTFDHREATQLWRKKIASIAADYKDITFAIANEDDHTELLKQLNLQDSSEDISIGIQGTDNKPYRMEPMEDFDSDEIREFLDKFQKGKLTPEIKSQSIPKKQSGFVKVVVGKNFKDVVMDKTKDVLIEFYAPWCGHCKTLEPIYNKLAKRVKGQKNVVIAKIDATANDSPSEFNVQGFPSIFFAPANNKTPIKYEGKRELEDFEKFLREHGTVSFGKGDKEEL